MLRVCRVLKLVVTDFVEEVSSVFVALVILMCLGRGIHDEGSESCDRMILG